MKTKTIETVVSVSDLTKGMMIKSKDGFIRTVSTDKIKPNYIYDGERYKSGITRIQFKVPTANGFRIEG